MKLLKVLALCALAIGFIPSAHSEVLNLICDVQGEIYGGKVSIMIDTDRNRVTVSYQGHTETFTEQGYRDKGFTNYLDSIDDDSVKMHDDGSEIAIDRNTGQFSARMGRLGGSGNCTKSAGKAF